MVKGVRERARKRLDDQRVPRRWVGRRRSHLAAVVDEHDRDTRADLYRFQIRCVVISNRPIMEPVTFCYANTPLLCNTICMRLSMAAMSVLAIEPAPKNWSS